MIRQPRPVFVQANAAVVGGTPVQFEINRNLMGMPGRRVWAICVDAVIPINNAAVGAAAIGNDRIVQSLLSRAAWDPPRTVSCEASLAGGYDLATLEVLLGYRPGQEFTSLVAFQGDDYHPHYDNIPAGGTQTKIHRWVIPLAIPMRGQWATQTALAAADLWASLNLSFLSTAELVAITGNADLSMGTISVRVTALADRMQVGTHIGTPLVIRTDAGLSNAKQQFTSEKYAAAFLDFRSFSGGGAQNQLATLQADIAGCSTVGLIQFRELWEGYRGQYSRLPAMLDADWGSPSSNVDGALLLAPVEGDMDSILEASIGYQLTTQVVHSFVRAYLATGSAGRTPEAINKAALERARLIMDAEGKQGPNRVEPQANITGQDNLTRATNFIALSEQDVATAQANLAPQNALALLK